MTDFRKFNKGDKFRIQLTHTKLRDRYPESIYCIFKSCTYIADSFKELIVDQIIDVQNLIKGEEYKTIERKLTREELSGDIGIYKV